MQRKHHAGEEHYVCVWCTILILHPESVSVGINTLVIHALVLMMQVQTWLKDLGVDQAVRQVFLEVHLGVHLHISLAYKQSQRTCFAH